MKRVLSLLLLIPFLVTQAWALHGGPYESAFGNSQSFLAGTYGVSLQGQSQYQQTNDGDSSTGILAFTVPNVGLASGRVLIFESGYMYMGSAQGHVDFRSGKISLLSQLSHYSVNVATTGVSQASIAVIDSMLSGVINLNLSLNYFSGLVEATGTADYTLNNTLVAQDSITTISGGSVTTSVQQFNVTLATSGTPGTRPDTHVIVDPTTMTDPGTTNPNRDIAASVSHYLRLVADGVREGTDTTAIPAFTAPSTATSFQVDAPAATGTTGTTGTTKTGG